MPAEADIRFEAGSRIPAVAVEPINAVETVVLSSGGA